MKTEVDPVLKESKVKIYSVIFSLSLVILIVMVLLLLPMEFDKQVLLEYMQSYESKFLRYLISLLLMIVCALTPMPAEVIVLVNAVLYSPLEAFIISWFSAVIGACIAYEIGRLSGFDACRNEQNIRVLYKLRKNGSYALVVMRLIPLVPFFALNICSGILALSRWNYLLITSITIIPAVAVFSFLPQLFL